MWKYFPKTSYLNLKKAYGDLRAKDPFTKYRTTHSIFDEFLQMKKLRVHS